MAAAKGSLREQDHVGKAMDIAVRLVLVGIVLISCMRILNPFIMPVVWGMLIAVALYSPYLKLKSWVGGRDKLAGGLFIAVTMAVIIVPTVWLTDSVIEGTSGLIHHMNEGTITIPPPQESVKTWPVIGESAYKTWQGASRDLGATVEKMGPQLASLGAKLGAAAAGLGASLVQTLFALLIAGLLLMNAEPSTRMMHGIARKLGGDKGAGMIEMSTGTIRSVVKGVLLVAALQGLLAAVGLFVASVPGAGLWALLVMMIAIMQLPPILILGPVAVWVFSSNDSTIIAVFFLIWSLAVSGSDAFLKPLFLGRGVKVPMLVILIGAIGGMLAAGLVGLFVGAVVLAIGYQLFVDFVREDGARPEPASAGE